MNTSSTWRPPLNRLVAYWALWGGISGGLISCGLLLPALLQRSFDAAIAEGITILAGASIGALAATLHQKMGRLRFQSVFFVGSVIALAGTMISRGGIPILWVGLAAVLMLTGWTLLARGLYILRKRGH